MSSRVREVLTLSEAAKFLRVSEPLLQQLAIEKKVPARKLGDDWRFLLGALQQWLRCDSPLENGSPPDAPSQPKPQTVELLLAELEHRLLPRLRAAEQPPLRGNKERLLALAGSWKD